ncbi:MAG: Ig-like domain-containing protein, partial [Candidatus Woesearchaeota archaeon]
MDYQQAHQNVFVQYLPKGFMMQRSFVRMVLLFFFFLVSISASSYAYQVSITWNMNMPGYDVELYHCQNPTCSAVVEPPKISASSSSTSYLMQYTAQGTSYHAAYFFKSCYRPLGYVIKTTAGGSAAMSAVFEKHAQCKSTFVSAPQSVSVTAGQPLTITATLASAFSKSTGNPNVPVYIPTTHPEAFTSDVKLIGKLYQGSNTVLTRENTTGIFIDTTKPVSLSFDTIGLAPGTYSLVLESQVVDCICSSSVSQQQSVQVTVLPPLNQAPLAYNLTLTTAKNTPVAVTLQCVDPENQPLIYSIVSNPQHGSLVRVGPVGSAQYTYTPAQGYIGDDSFTYRCSDGSLQSNVARVSISITSTNNAPVAVNDNYVVQRNSVNNPFAVLNNDYDPDGDALSLVSYTQPLRGSVSMQHSVLYYTPNAGYTGTDSFTYTITDNNGGYATGTVFIVVQAGQVQQLVAQNLSVSTPRNTPVSITLVCSPASPTLSYSIVSNPQHGSLVRVGPVGSAQYTYTPAQGYIGADSFTYRCSDGSLQSNVARVSISITSTNNAPVAVND